MGHFYYNCRDIWRSSKCKILPVAVFSTLPFILTSCLNSSNHAVPLTCTVEKREFIVTMRVHGMLDAKRSHVLTVPMIRRMENGRMRMDYQQEIADLVPEGTYVHKGDVVASFSPGAYEKALVDAERAYETAKAELSMTEAMQNEQRAQLNAEIETANADANSSRLQLSRLPFVAELERRITQLRIEKAEVQAQKAKNKLDNLVNVHKAERNEKTLAVQQAERRIADAKTCLEQMRLQAPVDGYVKYERNRMTGEPVKPGEKMYARWAVVRIPDLSQMQVTAQLTETMAQKVEPDQRVMITIPSRGDSILNGNVLRKERVAVPVKRGSKVKQVEVILTVDSLVSGLAPGLSAVGEIVIQEQSDVLVVPLDCIFDNDSAKVVYLKRQDRFVATKVTIASRGENFVVIESGVAEGDQLAILMPPDDMIETSDQQLKK